MTNSKFILKIFCSKCMEHLNSLQIPAKVGKHKIGLSSRTLSDVIEKHTIGFMIDYFGEDKVKFKNWRGYDVIIITLEETLYVNIKTNEHNKKMDATWLFSASIVKKLQKQKILQHLYCVKFEYIKENRDYLEFLSGKVAGPLSEVDLIYYTKGDNPSCKLRTEFNGTHCHLLNKFYV
ncbi:MAG: hypothetical protein COS68_02750 [Elusimicrobia bacterium CG06_land_8_20_14_3_00_38_11]|nr:MAG: hypothetical protein COS68_02750 [Elusimicrobia bacterium CG06_land_8_20_14_3_00_38_11]